MKSQQGFTLIELVVVIVLLGILAVTAAPKFIDLQDDARTATLNAVKASMQSASTLVYSKSLIKGNQDVAAGATNFVTVNGVNLEIVFGYPLADYSSATGGDWDSLLDLDPEFSSLVNGSEFIVYPVTTYPSGAEPTLGDACTTSYLQPAASGAQPTITVNDC